MTQTRHDYRFRPDPRSQDGYFIPPGPIPMPKHPDNWTRRDMFDSVMAMSRNPVEATTLASMTSDYYHGTMLGQTMTVLGSPDMIKYLFVERAQNLRMHPVRQTILRPVLQDGLITAEGEEWRFMRRALAPVFVPRQTKEFATRMRDKTIALLPKLLDNHETIDIAEVFLKLAYGVLSDTLFSGEIDNETENAIRDIAKFLGALGKADPLDILMAPKWMPRLTKLGGKKAVKRMRQSVHNLSKDRRQRIENKQEVPDDFLTLLLRIRTEDGKTLSDSQIEDQLITFIGAGHETTSRAMTWLVYLLSQDENARIKSEKEIDNLDFSLPSKDWEKHMPWSVACFEETMRLYPPAPLISRQLIEDDKYQDLVLKKDSAIMINLWALHRHHDLWDNPDRFDPERFMPDKRQNIHRFQYLPFGLGHRVCIGQRFAMQEAAILMALVLKDHRFTLSGDHPWPLMRITTKPENPLMMRIERR